IVKANILTKNPLGELGGIVGGIQSFYLIIWVVIYIEHYELLPMAIGVLGASHFLPYLSIYKSKTYVTFTILVGASSFVFGYIFVGQAYSTLTFLFVLIYLFLVIGLRLETI